MKPIKTWRKTDRPRERFIEKGPSALSDAELLAIILRTGGKDKTAIELASELLQKFGSFRGLENVSIKELADLKFMGIVKSIQIKACLEIAKRYSNETISENFKITNKEDVIRYCKESIFPYMRDMKKEIFKIILLNTKNRVIKTVDVSVGTIDFSPAHPREILKEAVKESAAGIIMVHNHPSGDPSPSMDDLKITERMVKACEIVGVGLIDHVIIGGNSVFSFLEYGLISMPQENLNKTSPKI
jgi:DNA repair protein RadC